ncbi:MAG TPA: putative baseplate assembly protein, partial [Jatrophihabitans sp.]|nr:putative baseplate assembly protein [Jatrophihabitans sp.]
DDRHFQDLVDGAKRLIQTRCPQWTDHNVSDPGVTLVEAYAQMVDQLIYRLNRVPDRHYVKFLELIGVQLRPPSPARGQVTFWLSAPQPHTVVVREGTEVATPRTDVDEPIVFTTAQRLDVLPCSFAVAGSLAAGEQPVERTDSLAGGGGFDCFGDGPMPGDALLVGLSDAVPSCAVNIRLDCEVAGVGVDPGKAPLVWEAWTGADWAPCELDRDETGGLNKTGSVVLHVPPGHVASIIARKRAGWLRCRLVERTPGQHEYRESPHINDVTAFTIGGTVATVHAEVVENEVLGSSDGTPAQRFVVARRPVLLAAGAPTVQVVTRQGDDDVVEEWTAVESFADSGPDGRHFHLDPVNGEVAFGPVVREPDGTVTQYGAVPPLGARVRIRTYRTGGGRRGNVARNQIVVLKTSVPYVSSIVNRSPALGGADAESLADAKIRGPMLLRTRGRAVTREDFCDLARDVAPEAARVYCVTDSDGGVRLLVIPHLPDHPLNRIERRELDPPLETLARIAAHLEQRRLLGTRLVVEPPTYRQLTVVVSAHARPGFRGPAVRDDVISALNTLFHPLCGGPDGTGWPLGRAVQAQEVTVVLAAVPGLDMSRDLSVQLFPDTAGRAGGQQGNRVERLELGPTELVFSFEHQVRVRR